MPRVSDIDDYEPEFLTPTTMPWLVEALDGGFVRGGTYLLSGEPGVGESTLALQITCDLAMQGHKVLYITTEQSPAELKAALLRVGPTRKGRLPATVEETFFIDDTVSDPASLVDLTTEKVLSPGGEYAGVRVVVLDSIHGRGLSPAATRSYRSLYAFAELAKAHGIVAILVGHITKDGKIAGPKTLEHNVDCIVCLRRAFVLRPMFVPKNRFGPAVLDPIALVMNHDGKIARSRQAAAKGVIALGYGGPSDEPAEVQAMVSIPRFGSPPVLNAPGLPRDKVRQLILVLADKAKLDLSELSFDINSYLPESRRYREYLDLALAVALLGSYLQQPVPATTLFVGELDLMGAIRPLHRSLMFSVASMLERFPGRFTRVYVSDRTAGELAKVPQHRLGVKVGESVEVRGVPDLESFLQDLWPGLFD